MYVRQRPLCCVSLRLTCALRNPCVVYTVLHHPSEMIALHMCLPFMVWPQAVPTFCLHHFLCFILQNLKQSKNYSRNHVRALRTHLGTMCLYETPQTHMPCLLKHKQQIRTGGGTGQGCSPRDGDATGGVQLASGFASFPTQGPSDCQSRGKAPVWDPRHLPVCLAAFAQSL